MCIKLISLDCRRKVIHFYYDIINIQISREGYFGWGWEIPGPPLLYETLLVFVSLVVWVAVLLVSCNWLATKFLSTINLT